MRYVLSIWLICLSGCLWAQIPNHYEYEVSKAQTHAELLLAEIKVNNTQRLKSFQNYRALEAALSSRKCPGFKYKGYQINHDGEQLLYMVARKGRGKRVIVGRHMVAKINNNNVDIESITSSTKGCLDLGKPPKNRADAMFVTSLAPSPNTFHLLQSQLNNVSLYVSTSYALWRIQNGMATLVKLTEQKRDKP